MLHIVFALLKKNYCKVVFTEMRDREEDLASIDSPPATPKWPKLLELCPSKPGFRSLFGSPTWVQSPKALGCPQLISQATGRELDGKQGHQDYNWHPYGILLCAR